MQPKIPDIYMGEGGNLKRKVNIFQDVVLMLCESSVNVEFVTPWSRVSL